MVTIKDMEMPKSCTECVMTHEDKQSCDRCEFTYSNVTHEVRNNLKASDCPLVEIEEHKQLLKLRSKINNAIEEIKQEIQNSTIKITSGNERLFNILKNIED